MGGDRQRVNTDGTIIITGLEPYIKNYVIDSAFVATLEFVLQEK
jgi:hypothetical protein